MAIFRDRLFDLGGLKMFINKCILNIDEFVLGCLICYKFVNR